MPESTTDESPGSVTRLLICGGDAAAQQLWGRYVQRLLTLARGELDRVVRARADEDDVVQSAFASFFRRWGDYQLSGARRALVAAGDLHPEQGPEHQSTPPSPETRRPADPVGGEDFDGRRRDPTQGQRPRDRRRGRADAGGGRRPGRRAREEGRNLESAKDPHLVRVARMKLEGSTNREIAGALRVSERSIERKINRIRSHWIKEEEATAPPSAARDAYAVALEGRRRQSDVAETEQPGPDPRGSATC